MIQSLYGGQYLLSSQDQNLKSFFERFNGVGLAAEYSHYAQKGASVIASEPFASYLGKCIS